MSTSFLRIFLRVFLGLLIASPSQAINFMCLSTFGKYRKTPTEKIYLPDLNDRWRPTEGSYYSAFRSNAPYIWSQLKKIKFKSAASQIEGLDLGDGHDFNFNFAPTKNGKSELMLMDFDDIGDRIPLLIGAAKRAAGNWFTDYRASEKELWEAYMEGLRAQKREMPESMQEYLEWDIQDYDKARDKYFEDFVKDGKRFYKSSGLLLRKTNGSFPDSRVQNLYAKLSEKFVSSLQKEFGINVEIKDVGFKTNKSGGSKGFARFWYLIRTEAGIEIIEFKYHPGSALKFFNTSLNFALVFQKIQKTISLSNRVHFLRHISTQLGNFWMRPRRPSAFNLDEVEASKTQRKEFSLTDPDAQKEVSLYMMWNYGYWQSHLPESKNLKQAIEQDPETAFEDFQTVLLQVEKLINQNHGRK